MYHLYALLKKNKIGTFSERLFYIGQTTDIKTRMSNHRYPIDNNRIKSGIIKKYGFEYIILESFENKRDCDEKEEFIIRFVGRIIDNSGPLANISMGTAANKMRYKESNIDSIIEDFLCSGISLRKYCCKTSLNRKSISRWCKSRGIIISRSKRLKA